MKKLFSSMRSEKGTLYSLVTKYYVFFAAAVLLLAFLVVKFTENAIEQANYTPNVKSFISNDQLIKNEKYDRLNIKKVLGEKSYFEVLDENAEVIYSSDGSVKNTYSPEELEFIPSDRWNSYYYLDTIMAEDGSIRGYALHKYATVSDREGELYTLSGVAILDSDKNVVYSDSGMDIDHLSEREFNILYGGDTDTYLQKYEYVTNNGESRTMLIHQDYSNTSLNDTFRRIYLTAIFSFLFVFAIFVIIFVFRTALAVRKPITMLQNAMDDLGEGNRDVAITYSGPKEFVQIMDSFNDMTSKLAEAEREKEGLEKERQKILADISHDLKTPITVIQGYSKAVADGLVPEEEQKKYLETINRKADNLSELINSFYEYSKLEHPEFSLYKRECDICEYFREYLANKYSELEIAGYEMEIDIPEEKITKSIDDAQLKRVFENIINNSVKSNPKGTKIFAAMKQSGENVIIYLGDDGVGVPEVIQDEIFKPFVVGEKARTSGKGTGLGLSIAKLIVEAHGGTIRLMDDSESGYSTIFEIIL
ncbi:sensor histidine kinase [Butyrivibrio sp. XPD2002]|uniref:sensor histidine kinase n=1 Tax=Butyrivibrio sp. XPD2002 TaxID=1280665 RepID=UPI0004144CD0|nr:HAMP domain-containing sensor histidine kinase [Butyrivibrio sp. XPD2002]